MSRTAEPILSHKMPTRFCHHAKILRQQYDLSMDLWKKKKKREMKQHDCLQHSERIVLGN